MHIFLVSITVFLPFVVSFSFSLFNGAGRIIKMQRVSTIYNANSLRFNLRTLARNPKIEESFGESTKLPIPENEFGLEDPDKNLIEWNPGLPDKKLFRNFFKSICSESKTISVNQLCTHPDIQLAFSDGQLGHEDIEYIWDSEIPLNQQMLNSDGAYELFCCIMDIPDPELLQYLNSSFIALSSNSSNASNGEGVSLESFLGLDTISEALDEDYITADGVRQCWIEVMGTDTLLADRSSFGKIYSKIAQMVDEADTVTNQIDEDIDPE